MADNDISLLNRLKNKKDDSGNSMSNFDYLNSLKAIGIISGGKQDNRGPVNFHLTGAFADQYMIQRIRGLNPDISEEELNETLSNIKLNVYKSTLGLQKEYDNNESASQYVQVVLKGNYNSSTKEYLPDENDAPYKENISTFINNFMPDEIYYTEEDGTTIDILSLVLGKVNEGMSSEDISSILTDLYSTGESDYVDEEDYLKPVDEEAVVEEDAKTQEYKDTVNAMIDELGIPFDDATREEAVDYFSTLLKDGSFADFQVRQLLQQMPEYQTKLQEEERLGIEKETGELQGQLGEQLTREGEQFLQEKALPSIERQYAGLGGEERVSTEVAKAKAIRDVAQARETGLTETGLQSAVTQEGYNREDYLLNSSANYNMSLSNWNNMNQNLANERTVARQKYWVPLSIAESTAANERASTQQKESQQWQEYIAKTQRSWQQQDASALAGVQQQQNVANLLGYGVGTAIGAYAPKLFNGSQSTGTSPRMSSNLNAPSYNQFWR